MSIFKDASGRLLVPKVDKIAPNGETFETLFTNAVLASKASTSSEFFPSRQNVTCEVVSSLGRTMRIHEYAEIFSFNQ